MTYSIAVKMSLKLMVLIAQQPLKAFVQPFKIPTPSRFSLLLL